MLKNIIFYLLFLSIARLRNNPLSSPWNEVIQSDSGQRKVISLLSLAQLCNLFSNAISHAKRRQRESNGLYFGQLEWHLIILLILEILQLFWWNLRSKWWFLARHCYLGFSKKRKKKVMIFMILRLLCNFEGLRVGKYNFRKVWG